MPRKPAPKKPSVQKSEGKAKPRAARPVVVDAEAIACRRCHSTDREPYFNVRTVAIAGVATDGRPYTHVVWRRTRCACCGQVRDEKTFENRIKAAA